MNIYIDVNIDENNFVIISSEHEKKLLNLGNTNVLRELKIYTFIENKKCRKTFLEIHKWFENIKSKIFTVNNLRFEQFTFSHLKFIDFFPYLTKLEILHSVFDMKVLDFNKCINLEYLNISFCNLQECPKVDGCTKLRYVDWSGNMLSKLRKLPETIEELQLNSNPIDNNELNLQHYTKLKKLSFHKCNLNICPDVDFLHELVSLNLSRNNIKELKLLPNNLKEFNVQHNLLTEIGFIPTSIEKLNISCNPLKKLPQNILMCTRMRDRIYYFDTQIVLTEPEIRFMERIERRLKINYNHLTQIYQDNENVHASTVQKSVLISCQNLFLDNFKDVYFQTTGNSIVDKIIYDNFKCSDIHSILLFSYKEIFQKVWNRICNCENVEMKNELMTRLKEEILESEGKCFTGQITRLLNVFVGFYSDIFINISDADQIHARIMTIIKKNNGKIVESEIYDSLREIEVDDFVTKEWIESLTE